MWSSRLYRRGVRVLTVLILSLEHFLCLHSSVCIALSSASWPPGATHDPPASCPRSRRRALHVVAAREEGGETMGESYARIKAARAKSQRDFERWASPLTSMLPPPGSSDAAYSRSISRQWRCPPGLRRQAVEAGGLGGFMSSIVGALDFQAPKPAKPAHSAVLPSETRQALPGFSPTHPVPTRRKTSPPTAACWPQPRDWPRDSASAASRAAR